MLVPKRISLALGLGLLLSTSAQASSLNYPTVFGYRVQHQKVSLTEDGHNRLQTQHLSAPQQDALRRDVQYLARTLNHMRSEGSLNPQSIMPVITYHNKQLQYEVWHHNIRLMRLDKAWKKPGESALSCLVRITNRLRQNTGAPAITTAQVRSKISHQEGQASWYGGFFHGRRTANGERYDIKKLTAAHKKLPFGTRVLVTNTATQKSVVVKINDRGPFVGERIIDLSPEAFKRIGNLGQGVMSVKLTILNDNA